MPALLPARRQALGLLRKNRGLFDSYKLHRAQVGMGLLRACTTLRARILRGDSTRFWHDVLVQNYTYRSKIHAIVVVKHRGIEARGETFDQSCAQQIKTSPRQSGYAHRDRHTIAVTLDARRLRLKVYFIPYN